MLTYNQRYKPRTEREYTKSDLTVYNSAGNTALNTLKVYGKSEVVDGVIKSAGEGYAVVDLGTLDWTPNATYDNIFNADNVSPTIKLPYSLLICNKYKMSTSSTIADDDKAIAISTGFSRIYIKDTDYTDPIAFKNSLNGVLLCYQLADPTQGNTIAIKTDNGTGINGTMATFSTGTPLYGVSDTVRDVMQWDGSAGTVTKICGEVDLSQLEWIYLSAYTVFGAVISGIKIATAGQERIEGIISSRYPVTTNYISTAQMDNKSMMKDINSSYLYIKDTDYTTVSDFVDSLGDAELVYELATPTTEPLTQTENTSIASLRTFDGTTHFTNNASTDMTANYTIKVPTIS